MKRMFKTLAVTAALLLPVAAMAAPGGGILGTDHDFASASSGALTTQTDGKGNFVGSANQVGLCSYCHTPHSALSTSLLWNHTLSANTFTWDDAKTTGGTSYASISATYKGPTIKCLSCHDGTVAIGDVSMYKETKAVYNTYKVGGDGMTTKVIGAGGKLNGNHPVGMPYPFGQKTSTYNGTSTGGDVVLTEFAGNPTTGSTAKIKLFNDNGSGVITGGAKDGISGLECSSCHDPHNKSAIDDFFLRGKVAGSAASDGYICVQCHIK